MTPSQEQQQIIDTEDSLVVIARPGSGKTFVLANKIQKILLTLDEYQGVIAISYTRKASKELMHVNQTCCFASKTTHSPTVIL